MVSTPLNNISQIGSFPQIGMKIKNIWNHHLDQSLSWFSKRWHVPTPQGYMKPYQTWGSKLCFVWKRGSDRLISSRNFCNLSAPQKEILHLKSECLRLRMSLVFLEEFPQGFCSSLPAFVLAKWIILQHQIPTCVKRTLLLSPPKKIVKNPWRSCTWFVRLATPPS